MTHTNGNSTSLGRAIHCMTLHTATLTYIDGVNAQKLTVPQKATVERRAI